MSCSGGHKSQVMAQDQTPLASIKLAVTWEQVSGPDVGSTLCVIQPIWQEVDLYLSSAPQKGSITFYRLIDFFKHKRECFATLSLAVSLPGEMCDSFRINERSEKPAWGTAEHRRVPPSETHITLAITAGFFTLPGRIFFILFSKKIKRIKLWHKQALYNNNIGASVWLWWWQREMRSGTNLCMLSSCLLSFHFSEAKANSWCVLLREFPTHSRKKDVTGRTNEWFLGTAAICQNMLICFGKKAD